MFKEKFVKIKELLTDKSKWCKGAFALDENGEDVGSNSPNAIRWCLQGALNKCYSYGCGDSAHTEVHAKLSEATYNLGMSRYLPAFNDAATTTFDHIRQIVEELDV